MCAIVFSDDKNVNNGQIILSFFFISEKKILK